MELTMEKGKTEKSLRKKLATFKPNKKYLKNAVTEYLDKGGKITKLNTNSGYYGSVPFRGGKHPDAGHDDTN